MAHYYFPTSTPAKIRRAGLAGASSLHLAGFELREATQAEQAQIDAGQTYWTPTLDYNNKPLGIGTLSAPPSIVPKEIAAWRGRAILRLTPGTNGTLYDEAVAMFDTFPNPMQTIAKEVFHGVTWSRTSPVLLAATSTLGMSSEQVDALFVAAANLPG